MTQQLTTALLLTALLAAPAMGDKSTDEPATSDRAVTWLQSAELHHVSRAEQRPCRMFTEPTVFYSFSQSLCELPRGTVLDAALQWRWNGWYQRGPWSDGSLPVVAGIQEPGPEECDWACVDACERQCTCVWCCSCECEVDCGCREDDCP